MALQRPASIQQARTQSDDSFEPDFFLWISVVHAGVLYNYGHSGGGKFVVV